MVIRRMNALFIKHGRIFFGVFTVVIIISFIGFFTPGFTSIFSGGPGMGNAVGRVLGKKLTYDELRHHAGYSMIAMSLLYGIPLNNSSMRDRVMDQSFESLCLLRAAQARGIRASDAEVAEFLRHAPVFSKANVFDKEKYEDYVKNNLTPSGFNKRDMDEAVRDYLTINSLMQEIGNTVIVTPGEVRTFFNSINEKFDVRVGRCSWENFKAQAQSKLDDKALQAFFNANKKNYTIPVKYQADFIRFNYDVFEKDEIKDLTEAAIKEYFESHRNDYKNPDGKLAEFDTVKLKAKEAARRAIAKKKAMENASSFVVSTSQKVMDSAGKVEDVRKIFAESKLPGGTTDWFEAGTTAFVKPVGREPAFVSAVAALYEGEPLSNAIEGENSAFVALVTAKQNSRQAEYAEVKEKVLSDCIRQHAVELARDRARELFKKISDSPKPAQAIESLKEQLHFEKVDSFVLMMPPSSPNGAQIARLAAQTPAGKLAPIENTLDGAILIFVDKRQLPSDADFEKQKASMEMLYKMQKREMAKADFQSWLQSQTVRYGQSERGPESDKGQAQQQGLEL